MPRIIPYEQQTRAPQPGAITLDRGPAAAGILGQVVESLAEDQAQLKAFERQKAEERAAVAANDSVMGLRSRWAEELPKRQAAATEGADGFALGVLADFDAEAEAAIKAAPTEASRAWVKDRLGTVRLALQQDALGFEAQRAVESKVNGLSRSIDQARIAAEFRPQDFGVLAAEQVAAIDASGLPADLKAKLLQDSTQAVASASVQGMIRRDPRVALNALNDEKTKELAVRALSFDQRQRLRGEAETEIRRLEYEARARQSEARESLTRDLADAFAARQAGLPAQLPGRERFQVAYGTDGGERYTSAVNNWRVFDVVAQAAHQPPEQALQTLEQLRPKAQGGAAEAAQRYNQALQLWGESRKKLELDPVGTLMARDAELAALAQQATDPESAQRYIDAVKARQEALGVPKPRLLPDEFADRMARSLMFNPDKPMARVETLAGLQMTYGRNFPAVVAEISPKLDGHARVIVNMTPEDARRLDAALAQDPKVIADLLPNTDQADITTEVDAALAPFAETLADNPDAESRLHEHREAARLLAGSMILRGSSPSDAAEAATDAVINSRYSFEGTARIPIQYDADRVMLGARMKLRQLGPLSITPGNRSDAGAAQEDIQEHVRSNGYWITNEDDTGLILRIPHRRGQGEVYDATGRRVEFTWEELLSVETPNIEPPDAIKLRGFGGRGY